MNLRGVIFSCVHISNLSRYASKMRRDDQKYLRYVCPPIKHLGAHIGSDFAAHLIGLLDQSDLPMSKPCPDISPYMIVLPISPANIPKDQRSVMRDYAVRIWNLCNTITDVDHDAAFIAQARAFACLLLGSVASQNTKKPASVVKFYQSALVAGRSCLRASLFDLAEKVTDNETAIDILTNKVYREDEWPDDWSSCVVEYYCLRILLGWKRNRLDLADFWYTKMTSMRNKLDELDAEKVIDLYYEIGQNYLTQDDTESCQIAVNWLERACSVMNSENYEHMFSGSDLRLSVMHSFGMFGVQNATNAFANIESASTIPSGQQYE